MDVVLLRTLARKSKFNFGRDRDLCVQDLLNTRQQFKLAMMYYTCSKISFQDDILEELRITGDLVIEKPSKNKSIFIFWREKYIEHEKTIWTNEQRMGQALKAKKTKTRKEIGYECKNRMSKSQIRNIHRNLTN